MKGLIIISCVELISTIFAIKSKNIHFLRAIIVMNMVMISLFAPILIGFNGFMSNIGNIFYATVIGIQMYILMHFGSKEAFLTINKITFLLFALSGMYLGINFLDCGNEVGTICGAAHLITTQSPLTLLAAVFAFIIGQSALITSYGYFIRKVSSAYLAAFLAILVAQIFDSVVFFTIAFKGTPGILNIIITGVVFKVLLALITLPVLKLK